MLGEVVKDSKVSKILSSQNMCFNHKEKYGEECEIEDEYLIDKTCDFTNYSITSHLFKSVPLYIFFYKVYR